MLDMHAVEAEQKIAARTRAGGRARVSAPRTMVRHVEVLVMEQQLALLILGDLDPYPRDLTRRASPPPNVRRADNALAESTIGLFKKEAIRDGSPFRTGPLRTIDDVEWVTAGWVDWYNARRLHSTLGDVPPDEYEAAYYADLETPAQPALAPA